MAPLTCFQMLMMMLKMVMIKMMMRMTMINDEDDRRWRGSRFTHTSHDTIRKPLQLIVASSPHDWRPWWIWWSRSAPSYIYTSLSAYKSACSSLSFNWTNNDQWSMKWSLIDCDGFDDLYHYHHFRALSEPARWMIIYIYIYLLSKWALGRCWI